MTISLKQLPYDPKKVYASPLDAYTQSSIGTALACPQKFVFQYLLRLRSKGPVEALVIGTAVHKGLEHLIINTDKHSLGNALKAIDQHFESITDGSDEVGPSDFERIDYWRAQARAMIRAYHSVQLPVLADFGEVIATEAVIYPHFKTPTPINTLKDARQKGAGKIDGVVKGKERVYILEHKTRKSLEGLDVGALQLDHQVLTYITLCQYLWSIGELQKITGVEDLPTGLLYDAIMKPQHRQGKGETMEALEDRMYEAMLDAPDRYFRIEELIIDDVVIERAADNFQRVTRWIESFSRENVFMNLTSCSDYGGCMYRNLCQAGADAANPLSVLKMPEAGAFNVEAEPHPELVV